MRARSRRLRIALAATALFLSAGCAGSRAPRGWLPDASEAARAAHGGWIEVYFSGDQFQADTAEGELLGLSGDQLYLLTSDSILAVPLDRVERARLEGYDPGRGTLPIWTLAGTISTISHGVGLVISAPVWIIGGSAATASQSRQGRMDYPKKEMDPGKLAMFARFPQGIPMGLDLHALKRNPRAIPPPRPGGERR